MGWYDSCSSDSSSEYSYDPTWYYAVVVGRSTGIYTDHEDAMQQVYGYSGFRMKKFYDYQEVHEYVKDYGGYDSSTEDTDDEEEDEDMWYYAAAVGRCTGIYTDHEDAMDQEALDYIEENQLYYSSEEECDSEEEDLDWYYAVAVGRCAGIFTSVDDALEHTRGYSYAKFKKFPTFEDAQEFLNQHNLEVDDGHSYTDSSRMWFAYDMDGGSDDDFPDPKHPDTLVAFCDGSALRNGQRDCDVAYACIFPHNRDWDAVKTVKGPWATNNRAEFLAGLAVMRRANREDPYGDEELYIFTDSSTLNNSMTNWTYKWRHNGWKTASGTPVKNRDVLQQLLSAQGGRRVIWRHVKAHTGSRNWESHWNAIADAVASEHAQNYSSCY